MFWLLTKNDDYKYNTYIQIYTCKFSMFFCKNLIALNYLCVSFIFRIRY